MIGNYAIILTAVLSLVIGEMFYAEIILVYSLLDSLLGIILVALLV